MQSYYKLKKYSTDLENIRQKLFKLYLFFWEKNIQFQTVDTGNTRFIIRTPIFPFES